MGNLKKTLFGAALAVSMSGAAFAADIPVIEHTPEVIPAEVGSGWYLRGDIGYSFNITPNQVYGGTPFSGVRVNDSWTAGIGFGYKATDNFRADLTIDYLSKYSKRGRFPCNLCTGSFSSERGSISAWTFLANAYYDIGTWKGFTPYIGVGGGAAYVSLGRHLGINPGQPNNSFASSGKWNLAFALMAGGSYELSDNLLIDAGYRYLWLGNTATGLDPTGSVPGKVAYKDLGAHQIRVGMRYMLD